MRNYKFPILALILLIAAVAIWNRSQTPDGSAPTRIAGEDSASSVTELAADSGETDIVTSSERTPGTVDVPDSPVANAVPNPASAAPDNVRPQISANVVRQIQAFERAKTGRNPTQTKVDSVLLHAEKMRRGEPIAEGVTALRVELNQDDEGRVLTDIKATVSDGLLERIEEIGGKEVSHFAQFDAVRAWLPLDKIEGLAARADVSFIQPAVEAVTNVGSVTSEGDAAHAAPTARTQFSVDGSGIKVGVLSDSVDHMPAAQASGDLPNVNVLQGQAGSGSGEGTAMLEIVHDLAPGAELHFATGFGGAAAFAQNIRDLRFKSGCDIIIDDVTYHNESPFQDGVISQAVNAITENGALFFSSAANSGNKNDNTSSTWEGDFVDGGDFAIDGQTQGRIHDFGGVTHNVANRGSNVNLFWADPLGNAANDYDIYIVDANGSSIVAASNSTQNGTQDPYEALQKVNDGERVLIVKFSGDARFLHLDLGRGRLAVSTSGSTRGHNASRDGFSVAAVDANTSFPAAFTGNTKNPVETFSSDGFRRMFYRPDGTPFTPGNFSSTGGTLLQKPDIAAADGVKTTLPGDSGLNPFFGTSAAAPHAGAVAALLKSYNPSLTAAQVRSILTGTALDIEAPGFDRDSGFGIVMPVAALLSASAPELPSLASFAPAGGGIGANVTITGTKFNGTTRVTFNEVEATFTVDSGTQISTTVPAGATSGRIAVTTPAGTATSTTDFTVQSTPSITRLTPSRGTVGTTVSISGANLNGATSVSFNNVDAPGFTVENTTLITVSVPNGATSGRVSVTTGNGTATSPEIFTVSMEPAVTAFAPTIGGAGISVGIDGANFTGATAVTFNGMNASSFTVDSPVHITAVVPAGATSGPIAVTTANGTATSAGAFSVVPVPSISGFTPASGPVGSKVTINGSNLGGTTVVRFNGVNAAFTVDSNARISATVPPGATSGSISATSPGGTATSAESFTVNAPPSNDNFAAAETITGASGTVSGNNLAATKEAGEPDHAGNPGGRSIWYRWTAPSTGVFEFTTIGSDFDTTLAVHTGTSVSALTQISGGDDTPDGKNSTLTFAATQGLDYRIAVDGFRSQGGTAADAEGGNVTLNWATSTTPVISGFTPASGARGAIVMISGANFSGISSVRFNGVGATFTVDNPSQITASVPATATTGTIVVSGPNGSATSALSFSVVNRPPNDDFANAQNLSDASGSIPGRNTDATKEPGEPNHADNPGGRSIWYTWTAPDAGRWSFDTQGSGFDTVLAIFTGGAVDGLSVIAANDDTPPGTSSRVAFNAVAGTTYRIAIDGRNGASGTTVLNWAFTPNPPEIASFTPMSGSAGSSVTITGNNLGGTTGVRLNGVLASAFTVDSDNQVSFAVPLGANSGPISVRTPDGTAVSTQPFTVNTGQSNDQFAGAFQMTGTAAIVAGKNIAATKENGEPDHAGDAGGRSLWYRWTAPSSGTWALDTAGSTFDTTLAVYTGTSVNALSEIGSNDDEREDRTSRTLFQATANTTYQFAVDGFSGDSGDFVLKLIPAVAPEIIYGTGFEAAEGFNSFFALSGQQGWLQDGSGGNGILIETFPGLGQQGAVGLLPPDFGDDYLLVWPPVNFTPQTSTRPVVRFSVLMGIIDSTNFVYDGFHWSVFNMDGDHLFTVAFDNFDLNVYYRLDDGNGYQPTGITFENGPIYDLVITMDFARNRWSATLRGASLVSELPITTTGSALNLGDIDAGWQLFEPFFPGNNGMVFDEYVITSEPSETPFIELFPQDQTVPVGASVDLTVAAGGGEPLHYQWQFNGTPLPGQNSPSLSLINVGLGQSGNYSVEVSNATGTATGSANLSVNEPGPVTIASGALLADGRFQLTATGTPGTRISIEYSSNLVQWIPLTTVVLTGDTITLADPDAGSSSRRFYRVRRQ